MAESTMNIIKIQDTVGDNHKIGAETATKLQSSLSTSGTENLYDVGTDGKSIVYFNDGIPVKSTVNLGNNSTPLYLKSGVLTTATDLLHYGDVLMPTNPFGGKAFYISAVDNAFYDADKHYWVRITTHKKVIDGVTYPYIKPGAAITDDDYFVDSPVVSTLSAHSPFDGSYETNATVNSDSYLKVHIQFAPFSDSWTPSGTSAYFPGYPYGTYYLSYYYTSVPTEHSKVRIYNKYASHTIGWKEYTCTTFAGELGKTNFIEKLSDSGDYRRSCVEFIIQGNTGNAGKTQLTEIDYQLSRPNLSNDSPTFTKYGPQTIYETTSWSRKVGNADTGANEVSVSIVPSTGKITSEALETDDLKAAGTVILDGNIYPNNKGTAGQVMTTDGQGTLYWSTITVPTIPNGFANIKVGSDTVAADTTADTVELVAGGSATITADSTNDKITISATDTKNTAGSTNTSDKIFLVGAKTQGANPQTYSHDTAYVGTDGCLYSGGQKVLTAHQTLGNGQLDIQVNGTSKGTFTANQATGTNTTVNITAEDLGLSSAMNFIGVSTTDPKGSSGATVSGHTTWSKGDVVLYGNKEYVLTGTTNIAANWTELGDESSYALKTITITGTGALSGGGDLSQNRTITHKSAPTGLTPSAIKVAVDSYGHVQAGTAITPSDIGAATSGHTHNTSIATSTATSSITLSHGGKYSLTAGGTSFVFTMPTDNNTTYTLTQDATDGHKLTFTPSTGGATTITIPDNNTHNSHALTVTNGNATAADGTITFVESVTGCSATSGNLTATTTRKTITIPASANNGKLTIKSKQGDTTTTVADFSADQSSNEDITLIAGTYITLTPNATDQTITIKHNNSGVTAGSYGDSSAQTPAYGGTFKVPYITVDAQGHITGISAHNVTVPSDSGFVHKAGAETITGDKTFQSTVHIQNGSAAGGMSVGADVNAKTLTANTRKLGRIGSPAYGANSYSGLQIAAISFDNQSTTNFADFGGHPKNTSSSSPDVVRFVVANTHNTLSATEKTAAMTIVGHTGNTDVAGGDIGDVGINMFVAANTSNLTPITTDTYNIGTSTKQYNNIYGKKLYYNGQDTDERYLTSSAIGNGQLSISANSGSHLTASGTFTANQSGNSSLTIGVSSGYAIPTSTQISNWDTAYGWGNHADAGYLDESDGRTISNSINDLYDTKADSDHTHTTSIATSTGTSQISLAHGGKYSLNAGGTSYIFTMPSAPTIGSGTFTVKSKQGSTVNNVADFGANQTSNNDITFIGGSNITLTPDSDNRTITIAASTSSGTITRVKTTAGAHTAIDVSSGAANFNVPTKTSHLTNDSGFLTSHQSLSNIVASSATSSTEVTSATSDPYVNLLGGGAVKDSIQMVGGTGISVSGTAGKVTINHSNSVTAGTASEGGSTRTLAYGGTFNVPSVTYDAQGHITGKGSVTLTLPASDNTDTKQNVKTTTSTYYLTGVTTQPTSSDQALTGVARTDVKVGAAGDLYATSIGSSSTKIANGYFTNINGVAVGSSPKFTDTDTKVTSASNHYGYSSGSGKSSGLYKIATDDAGHVTSATAVAKADITALGIPGSDTDTKNTAGATDTSSKIYLIGATAQTANPQTYSNDEVFVDTDADLNAPTMTATNNRFNFGSNAYAEYNATDKCINFIFN